MAHNLEIRNGKASFVSHKEKAWHGLGLIVDNAMTSEEAIKLARLDYEVSKTEVLMPGRNGFNTVVPDKFVTFRKDTNEIFGVVGNRYEIVQNRDAFTFFDAIVGQGQAIFETAGALGIGERIFLSAKMPDYIRIAGTNDITEVYVLLTSSHDGSGAVIAAITPVRVCCQNTLNAALGTTKNKISIRHTMNVEAKMAQAHKLLGISNEYITAANEAFNALALKKVSDAQVKDLIVALFPSAKKDEDSTRILNIRKEVFNSYASGIGQSSIMGTAWGAFNGVTHYLDHAKDYKDLDSKFSNIIDGASSQVTDNAMTMLLAL